MVFKTQLWKTALIWSTVIRKEFVRGNVWDEKNVRDERERVEAKIRLRQFISLPSLPVCLFSRGWGEAALTMQGSIGSFKSLNKCVRNCQGIDPCLENNAKDIHQRDRWRDGGVLFGWFVVFCGVFSILWTGWVGTLLLIFCTSSHATCTYVFEMSKMT